MIRKLISLLVLITLLSGNGISQEISFPEMKGYNKIITLKPYTPANLWDHINGAADSYLSLGFRELHLAKYDRDSKYNIRVEVYRHKDPLHAFGIYTLERSATEGFLDIGVEGYRGEGMLYFLKGPYYVKLMTHSTKGRAARDMEKLAYKLEAALEGSESLPPEAAMLPETHREPRSATFIGENTLGHDILDAALTADYRQKDTRYTLYLFLHENPGANRAMLREYFSLCGTEAMPSGEGFRALTDPYNGPVFAGWKEGTTWFVTGLDPEQESFAMDILNQLPME